MSKQLRKKGIIYLLLLLVIIITIGTGIFLYRRSTATLTNTIPKTEEQLDQQQASANQETAIVEITDKGFIPSVIKIKKDTQITFINKDSKQHQVASDPHPTHTGLPGFDSQEPLNTDDSYSFTFESIGTFTYHDHLNPLQFKGTVIVQ